MAFALGPYGGGATGRGGKGAGGGARTGAGAVGVGRCAGARRGCFGGLGRLNFPTSAAITAAAAAIRSSKGGTGATIRNGLKGAYANHSSAGKRPALHITASQIRRKNAFNQRCRSCECWLPHKANWGIVVFDQDLLDFAGKVIH